MERREGGVDEIGDYCIPQGLWVNVGHMFGIRCPLKPLQELVRIHNAGGLRTVSSSGFIVSGSKPNAFGDERTYFVRSMHRAALQHVWTVCKKFRLHHFPNDCIQHMNEPLRSNGVRLLLDLHAEVESASRGNQGPDDHPSPVEAH